MEISAVLFIAMIVVVFVVLRGMGSGGKVRCNRCDGTGQVNERWPDPKEPGGWHIVEGTCPKCKGKGKF